MKITADQLLKIAGIAPSTTLRSRLNEAADSSKSDTATLYRLKNQSDAAKFSKLGEKAAHALMKTLRDGGKYEKVDSWEVDQDDTVSGIWDMVKDERTVKIGDLLEVGKPVHSAWLNWRSSGRTVKEAAANEIAISAAAHKQLTDMLTWLQSRPKGFSDSIFDADDVGSALDAVLRKELGDDFYGCKLKAGVLSCVNDDDKRVTLTSKSGRSVKESDRSAHNPYDSNEPDSAEFVRLADAGEMMTALVVDRDWSDNGRDYCYDITASIGGQQLKVQCLYFDREGDRLVTRAMDGKANALKTLTDTMSDQIKDQMG
jgi:hypothetical protein